MCLDLTNTPLSSQLRFNGVFLINENIFFKDLMPLLKFALIAQPID